MRYLFLLIGSCCAIAGLVAGCQESTEGKAVTVEESTPVTTTSSPTMTTTSDVPGVKETLPATVPPDSFVCFPPPTPSGGATLAKVADPVAPQVMVNVPDGWTSSPGTGDVALSMTGPDGMSGAVTIALTTLKAAAAFDKYSDDVAAKATISAINVRPAEFCGYSSQELFGTLSSPPAPTATFADRITHIWTNTNDYLVAIHLEGPVGAPGFDAAKATLMQDFAILIP